MRPWVHLSLTFQQVAAGIEVLWEADQIGVRRCTLFC